jgi:diamine N-acetyltransferase
LSIRPDAIHIRRAGPDDAVRLSHIGVATFIDSYIEDIDGEAMMGHCTRQHAASVYAAWLHDAHSACWLAEYESTRAPVGYAVLCPPDLPVSFAAGDLEVKRIYVLSRFHGTGTGKRLFEACLDEARARGAAQILLGTYEGNHRAVSFYERQGFTQCGTRRFDVGGKLFDDIVMSRSLTAA